MKRTALFASIALTAGLAAPAMAQEIGGVTVGAEDWPYVEEYCMTLGEETQADSVDEAPSSTEELSTSTIDLSTITRDDCVEAGLVDGPVTGGSDDGEMDDGVTEGDVEEEDAE
ncbi:hypothetical protein [Pelagibacterium halotolerans]|uniref:Uncharacterized protein n=1 Tax=Pelagibacterium halotolerans (strain DSM 22347 / JCM 15775 / CGMCC 1.7692 / B2) TaxID=1082931 RepID=G4RES9_PELHB|nr:hypothetical protein [Pelagibacterium halotolerans]AEQ51900.1 hypothetical protein KKY_1889 [Pelagibacterium halotolerans B2]QJR18298.1 hypothetical protein HKM20_07560 [Pelagibacterium halotolerans]SEA26449.1 hypothetical protein SAMN05428936_102522 [Pelagibacterium halotolerans]